MRLVWPLRKLVRRGVSTWSHGKCRAYDVKNLWYRSHCPRFADLACYAWGGGRWCATETGLISVGEYILLERLVGRYGPTFHQPWWASMFFSERVIYSYDLTSHLILFELESFPPTSFRWVVESAAWNGVLILLWSRILRGYNIWRWGRIATFEIRYSITRVAGVRI